MTVTFLGDVFLPEPFESTLRFDNYIPNLEYPITDAETPAKDKVVLRAKQSYLEETFDSKPTAVCLANNHIMDYGVEGFNDTLSFSRMQTFRIRAQVSSLITVTIRS